MRYYPGYYRFYYYTTATEYWVNKDHYYVYIGDRWISNKSERFESQPHTYPDEYFRIPDTAALLRTGLLPQLN